MKKLWTDEELKHTIQSYLQMLNYQENNTPYVKAEINRELQGKINRSKSSIEKRFQNISSVLNDNGLRFVQGYVPLKNVGPTNREKIWKLIQQLKKTN